MIKKVGIISSPWPPLSPSASDCLRKCWAGAVCKVLPADRAETEVGRFRFRRRRKCPPLPPFRRPARPSTSAEGASHELKYKLRQCRDLKDDFTATIGRG